MGNGEMSGGLVDGKMGRWVDEWMKKWEKGEGWRKMGEWEDGSMGGFGGGNRSFEL